MRVPDSANYSAISANLASLTARHAKAAAEVSSGYRVTSPSTDPRAAAEIAKLRHAVSRAEGFRSNIGAARGDAELAEGVLSEASALFERAQELAVQGANGTLSASERASMAIEISGLRDQLVSMANTRGPNGFLFSGSATDTVPFANTGAFAGNSDPHNVELGTNHVVNVAIDGAKAFTAAGGVNPFDVLDALATALSTNDQAAVIATLDNIRNAHSQIVRSRADAGLLLDRLSISESALDQGDVALKTRKAVLGEADASEAMSELVSVQNAIEQSLAVAKRNLSLRRFEP
ncbi:MAG: flagellar hook-associated protein FlgL [Polyangiaceae bacterium]|nr:flagellar hook-associated protein FlgL [Polyangiaceae bacterium]